MYFNAGGVAQWEPGTFFSCNQQAPKQVVKQQFIKHSNLKDPYSTKFRNIFHYEDSGVNIYCGQINAKNGFGGYTGWSYFTLRKSSAEVTIEIKEDYQNMSYNGITCFIKKLKSKIKHIKQSQ
jgi:hypothetical protein